LTLIELLVALGLSSLLISFVFSLQLFTNKLVIEWEKKAEVEEAALFCIHALCKDIRSIDKLIFAERQKIKFMDDKQKEITYQLRDKKIIRNGKELNKPKISVDDFQLRYYFKSVPTKDGYSSPKGEEELDTNLNLKLDGEELNQISGIEIKLSLSEHERKISLQSFVRLKKFMSVY
jgi:type II secretory pathway pseudopilin PulG